MAQKDLNIAKKERYDEYYTQLSDIEKELRHYKEHFKGKTVLCNCDDPYESNFFKYFAMNFNYLGLKKLISTCYVSSPVMYTQLSLFDDMEYQVTAPQDPNKKPYKVEITEVTDENGDGAFDLEDIKHLLKNKKNICKVLKGDGDYGSPECVELLKEADIVVTNPPFSLFREYLNFLLEHKKKFLIIGNQNAIHYKEIFPLIKNNEVWTGYRRSSGGGWYMVTKELENDIRSGKKRATWKEVNGVFLVNKPMLWFTNLDIEKRHEKIIMYKTYSPAEYPKYDNYDAIDVNSISEIPCDYFGCMGVPDSFLEIYNPEQFEIVACSQTGCHPKEMVLKSYKDYKGYNPDGTSNGRTGSTCGNNPMLVKNDGKHAYYMNDKGIAVQSVFSRIFIRRKDQPT